MYIIFSNKNKQYTINKNKFIKIDLIESNIGDKLIFKDILYFKNEERNLIGNPFIKDTELQFEVIKHIKDKKNIILKFKRRKNYLKKTGHRQKYTLIKLISINNKEV
ncbi:MAG TPA: 50S ribosomal protein L21 [Candidatus Azoamicus sp.]